MSRAGHRMKHAARIALVLGLATMIVLIVHEGGPSILRLLASAGWVLLWLVPLHVLPLALDVLGWWLLLDAALKYCVVPGHEPRRMPAFGTLLWIAAVREGVNRLLPVANIGGEVVGIRLVTEQGVDATRSAASVVLEVFLTLVAEYLYVALGIALMLRSSSESEPLGGLLLGLGIALALLAVLFVLLRYGSVFERLTRLIERASGWTAPGALQELDAAIRTLYARHWRLAATAFWQLAGLIAGSIETWLALRWLRAPITFGEAIALDGLTQAARQFIFVVPSGLGVQEAGFIGFGSLIGLPPGVAVTLSLVKRMREIVFGVPALVSWQWVEGWRGWPRKRAES